MKKPILIITPIVLVLIVIVLYVTVNNDKEPERFPEEESSPKITAEGDPKIGKLLEGMGIAQVPEIPLPLDIELPDLNGNLVNLSEFRGKIIFLNFWATWCPPCRAEMPAMEKLHNRLKHKDFMMIAIDMQEPAEQVKKYFEMNKLTFMALLDKDGRIANQFGIRSIPTTFILNKNLKIIGMAIGPREWDSKTSVGMFEQLMEQF